MATTESYDDKSQPIRDGDRLRTEIAQANLALMGALLNVEGKYGALSELFAALQGAFTYDQALVLESRGEAVECTASMPERSNGRRWPANAFQNVLAGGVLVSGRDKDAGGLSGAAP